VNLADYIRAIPDFPIPGILFRDITPLLRNARALEEATIRMAEPWKGKQVDLVASMEARGFIFGAAIAIELDAGFVPVRKPGRLPFETNEIEYTLEYRADIVQIHRDAVEPGQRVLVVDDLVATGGTAAAVVKLVENLGGEVLGAQFLIELAALGGRELLGGYDVHSVMTF
jgi:adenine phosphoribosyltransferase